MKYYILIILLFSSCVEEDPFNIEKSNANVCGNFIIEDNEECELDNPMCTKSCILARRIFVTSFSYKGNELHSADEICNSLANKFNLIDQLSWKAWISSEDENIGDNIYRSPELYIDLYGKPIALSFDDLINNELINSINVDNNLEIVEKEVWTGTTKSGNVTFNCNNWNNENVDGIFGVTGVRNYEWTFYNIDKCLNEKAIYCIEDTILN